MYKLLKELFNLLTPSQRRRFYVLQLLVIVMAIVEIFGVASIIPLHGYCWRYESASTRHFNF